MKTIFTFLLIVSSTLINAQVGSTCGTPYVLTLPFSQTNMTTDGFGDDFTEFQGCGGNTSIGNYLKGDDYVMTYTPLVDECITITFDNVRNFSTGVVDGYGSLFLMDDCPGTGNCI